jgi:rubrerythrin
MEGNITEALEILRQAMQVEQEGREFYLKAAQTTGNKKGQEMFHTLASDEKNHFNLLERQYNALKQDGRWIEFPEAKKRR